MFLEDSRRAARHGQILGIKDKFLYQSFCETVIEGSKDGYPELEEKRILFSKCCLEERR